MELDTTQEWKGKIKTMTVTTQSFFSDNEDFKGKDSSVIYFGHNNKPLKQTYCNKLKICYETIYAYNNQGLLKNMISLNNDSSTSRIDYKYDKNKNIIEFNEYYNDTLSSSIKYKYDKKKNIVESQSINPNNKELDYISKIGIDYKNRILFSDNVERNSILKIYYDTNGYLIKTENSSKNDKLISSFRTMEYDNHGNLTKHTKYGKDKKIIETITYENKYDQKGNIIQRELYVDKKLKVLTEMEIIYWQ